MWARPSAKRTAEGPGYRGSLRMKNAGAQTNRSIPRATNKTRIFTLLPLVQAFRVSLVHGERV
jgi:hypothetical protein